MYIMKLDSLEDLQSELPKAAGYAFCQRIDCDAFSGEEASSVRNCSLGHFLRCRAESADPASEGPGDRATE